MWPLIDFAAQSLDSPAVWFGIIIVVGWVLSRVSGKAAPVTVEASKSRKPTHM